MLDIKFIRENPDLIKENAQKRGVTVDVDALLTLDEKRRELLANLETLRADRNKSSKSKPTPEEIERIKQVGEEIKVLETNLSDIEAQYIELLEVIPNLTHPASPVGGEEDFNEVSVEGTKPAFNFVPKMHTELMPESIDFERGAKVAGSKFYFLKNNLVRLNQALINFAMDEVEKAGYMLIETPDMVRGDILEGSGFNPRSSEEDQIYKIENEDLNMIGTAEISVLGLHSEETLDLSNGPIKYAALSHCFRKESGAYGRESKGLYRVHQFSKLELFIFCKPEDSEKMHEELLTIEKTICNKLGLHFRVIDIPTGDLGGPAYRKFDLEAWMTMKGDEGGFGEITSTSNCTDYQARRMNITHKNADGKKEFVHTLNGTAVVLSRFPIAILEQFQNEDGTVTVPEALRPYMNNKATL